MINKNDESIYLINARKIKAWVEINDSTKRPSPHTLEEEEKMLGMAVISIRTNRVRPYLEMATEEAKNIYREIHPEIDEILEIFDQIDKIIKENKKHRPSVYLANARAIKKWMEENNRKTPPYPQSMYSEEKRLGLALNSIRENRLKPFLRLQSDEEREAFRTKHPEIDELFIIVNEIDRENGKVLLEQRMQESEIRRKKLKEARKLEKEYKTLLESQKVANNGIQVNDDKSSK